jgi:hypothetical protein
MRMSSRNIVLFALALLVGLYLGLKYPIIGLVLLIPLIAFVVIVLMRNNQGSLADRAELDDAMQLTTNAGKARIYVMRKGFVAGMQGMNITVDNALNGQIRSKYFLMTEVVPGAHSVTAQMSSQTGSTAQMHEFILAEGECILLDMKLDMGLLQGKIVFEETRNNNKAQQMLSGLQMVAWKQ